MSFLSIEWLAWVWLTVCLYWLTPAQFRAVVLIVLSFVFLASISIVSAAMLVVFCLIVHLATNVNQPSYASVGLACVVMLGTLIVFKIRETLQFDGTIATLIIPLGLSYYTFRCLHYMVERYRGHLPQTTLYDLGSYLFFLPTFVVGPIHRYGQFATDRSRQRFDTSLLSAGFERMIQGYAKIVILSNFVVEHGLGGYISGLEDQAGFWAEYLRVVKYGLNLFFQFSGHCDIAIGFALMLGFRVMENFNWPYLKPNISAFWQNWHISLSQWCREMIYGMIVAKTRSPSLAALTTMVGIGLWHEISIRYVLWGAMHGLALVVWSKFRAYRESNGIKFAASLQMPLHVASVLLTVHFVWFSFVLIYTPSLTEAARVYLRLLGLA
jgi:D-alanyl-lipoteichoic acid acyltransferase DltB (MBOAT superfamily)